MGTILKHSNKPKHKFRDSISFRIILICAIVALLLIAFINMYTLKVVEGAAYESKNEDLLSVANEYSSALSANNFDISAISSPLRGELSIRRRIIVVDASLKSVYDNYFSASTLGKTVVLRHAISALTGKSYFSMDIVDTSLESLVSVPVTVNQQIVGAVCVLESDASMWHVFSVLHNSMYAIAALLFFALILLGFAVSNIFLSRINKLHGTMRETLHDENINAIPIRYNDEIAPIIEEFNGINERLTYVQQMRRAFVSDASHELRTPLTSIRLLCESITGTKNMDSALVNEFINDIIIEVDRMSHTAEKLLVLSRLDNSATSALRPVSLSDVVRNMIKAAVPIALSKDVKIESYLEDDCSILGDTEGANQIVSNLIDNAIKYNNEGGTLRIYLFSKNGRCTFITDDTGIGIPPEHRAQVFDRFYRVDKARSHDGRGGSGLGLAIVKRNIESFGGTIDITDSVFGGTRFTCVFPSLLSDKEVSLN